MKVRREEIGQESVKVKRKNMKNRKWIIFPVMAVLILIMIGVAWLVRGRKSDAQQSGTDSIVEIVTERHRGQGVVFAIEENSDEIFILTAGHVMEGTEVGETVRISMLTDVSEKIVVSGSGSETGATSVPEGDSTSEGGGANAGIKGDSVPESNRAEGNDDKTGSGENGEGGGANEGNEGDSVAENGDTVENGNITENGTAARLVYRSETADLAILSVRQEAAGENLNCVKRDRAAFDAASEGDSVQARYLERSGGDLREAVQQGTLTYTWVYLEDFGLNMMVAELPAKSGMSGCGIFSAQGNFLGILCGVSAEGEAAILPLSVIESEWLLK